jgi:thiamine-monophosphate kinase
MMSERNICQLLSSLLPRGRSNECFESDSEIFTLAGKQYLFTTDEFCAEDLFREEDPFGLGWNVAAGAISDIFACGGKPLFYAHALTVNNTWDAAFIEQFGRGVAAVLEATGAGFIGGDCGRSELWRCTASVIGSTEGTPVLRRGARPGDLLYVSGLLGAGNLEAALQMYPEGVLQNDAPPPRFPLRFKEAALVREYASSCIDTSDGLLVSLDTLAELNSCGYSIADAPCITAGIDFCAKLGIPKMLLVCGECGEYELLFTVPPGCQHQLESKASNSGCTLHLLGEMTPTGRTLRHGQGTLNLGARHIRAREFENPRSYVAALAQEFGLSADCAQPIPGWK